MFAIELAAELSVAEDRAAFLRSHKLGLFVVLVAFPLLPALAAAAPILRLAPMLKLLKLAKLTKLYKVNLLLAKRGTLRRIRRVSFAVVSAVVGTLLLIGTLALEGEEEAPLDAVVDLTLEGWQWALAVAIFALFAGIVAWSYARGRRVQFSAPVPSDPRR